MCRREEVYPVPTLSRSRPECGSANGEPSPRTEVPGAPSSYCVSLHPVPVFLGLPFGTHGNVSPVV